MERLNRDERYLEIAKVLARCGTCIRRNYGAVIVKNDIIVGTGYTGAPRGEENCCDIGTCYRQENNIPSGEQYNKCKSCHAEMNAIISASARDMIDATLYLAGYEMSTGEEISDPQPCTICARLIKNARIYEVVNKQDVVLRKEISKRTACIRNKKED